MVQGIAMESLSSTHLDALDSGPLAYKVIRGRLLSELGQRWEIGERLPPIAKLAQELRAGQRNTHRAVRALVAEGVLSTRSGSGTYVLRTTATRADGSAAVASAPLLTGKRVAMIRHVRQLDPLILAMADQASAGMVAAGAAVELVTSIDRQKSGDYDLSSLSHDAGIMVNPGYSNHLALRPGMKLVVISTHAVHPAQAAAGFDVVAADEQQGALLAGRALRASDGAGAVVLGVGVKPHLLGFDVTSTQRRLGFEHGWGEPVPEACCLKGTSYMASAGARLVPQYLSLNPRPRAVFATSDELALGFRLGMLSVELEAGRDYQLVGFDGQAAALNNPDGSIATVAVPAAEMGRTAASLLIERFADPARPARRIFVDCQLVPGSTLRPVIS
jgi:DNA-binding LacI/PurR family transcriptional regulator